MALFFLWYALPWTQYVYRTLHGCFKWTFYLRKTDMNIHSTVRYFHCTELTLSYSMHYGLNICCHGCSKEREKKECQRYLSAMDINTRIVEGQLPMSHVSVCKLGNSLVLHILTQRKKLKLCSYSENQ